ncbi:MAG: L-aspartate oxidase [Sphingomonadales bacterium]
MKKTFDSLVIGSGAAGLTLALKLAETLSVALLSKSEMSVGATALAQGGIAAVLKAGDSIESHIEDTIAAGAGLSDPEAVRFVVEAGPGAIENLIGLGVPFTPHSEVEEGFAFHLTKEGGHSHRRVIHVDDATGAAVQSTLEAKARENPNIEIFENHLAIDLITGRHLEADGRDNAKNCHGAYVFDLTRKKVKTLQAKTTVLATGGASRVYLYSSNPDASTGDGIAMGWRAGCRVANMEFNQFHPTCLYHREAKSFLITEALRGEGAKVLLPDGTRFLQHFDPRAELAPRDIVARAIDHEMKRRGLPCVYLDISGKDADFVIGHFPNIYRRCLAYGFDITKEPIPVVPAAHYTCGGVMTDLAGKTDLDGLYAIGETAHTGLHGANRMASNSLLECLVLAAAAAGDIIETIAERQQPEPAKHWDESRVTDSDEEVVVSHNWAELRRFMWDYVGIVRTNKRLERANRRIQMLMHEVEDYYGNFRVTKDLLELRNLLTAADLMVRSAMLRKESRGLHYTLDYPDLLPEAKITVLEPGEE